MNDFFTGFSYPLRNLRLFFRFPKVIIYSIIPAIFNALIYFSSFIFFYSQILNYSKAVTSQSGFFADFLHILILIFAFITLLIVCYFIMMIIGGLFSAPFNENISLIIEESITGKKSDYNPPFFKDLWLNIKAESLKLIFYFSIIFLLFLIGFIPLIGSIFSVVLGTLFSFFFNALDFLDYPMTRKYFSLRQKIKVIWAKPMLTFGYGCAVFFITFLPIINILLKPVCVVSGTALFFEKNYLKS